MGNGMDGTTSSVMQRDKAFALHPGSVLSGSAKELEIVPEWGERWNRKGVGTEISGAWIA